MNTPDLPTLRSAFTPALLTLLLALLLAACSPDRQAAPSAETRSDAIAQAEAAAGQLMSTLVSELSQAMKEGGPTQAVEVCSTIAQQKTEEIGASFGLSIRRVALRARNDLDRPNTREEAILEKWSHTKGPIEPLREVITNEQGNAVLHYMRPILLGDNCVACHGPEEQIQPDVLAAIRAHYPNDRATGFQPSDLRGAISVEVPLDQP